MNKIRKYGSELRKYQRLCGKKGILEMAVDPAPLPEGCLIETRSQCRKRARMSIDSVSSNCHIKASKNEKFCDQFRASLVCWGEQATNAFKWS